MKKYEKGSEEYKKYDALQLLCKNMMNSVFGKYGLASCRSISEISSNTDLILKMI